MNLTPDLDKLLKDAAKGHMPAYRFLAGCHILWHGIDDILDGDIPAESIKEFLISLFIYQKDLCSCQFYREHMEKLSAVIDSIFNAYADSVKYEDTQYDVGDGIPWERTVGDVIRSQGVDIICIVAKICGGYEHMRIISQRARALSQADQRKLT